MSEEKPPSAVRIFLSQHGEKLGLGAAIAALLAYLVLGVFAGGENKSAAQVRESAAKIEDEAGKEHALLKAPMFPERTETRDNKPVKVVDELHDSEILKYWEKLSLDGTLIPAADWTASLLTKGEEHKIPYEKPTETPLLLQLLTLDKADTRLDGVTLTWTIKDPAKSDEKPADIAKIDTILIERVCPATNKTETFTVKDLKSTSYSDKTVEKRTKYKYRLIPVTSDEKYREKFLTDRGSATRSLEVSTLDIWDLTFKNPIPKPADKPDEKGYVLIKIVKFDKEAGQVDRQSIHHEGDKIGWWKEEWEEEKTDDFGRVTKVKKEGVISKHKVTVGGRSFTVDFDTKMTLTSVKEIDFEFTRKKCNPKYDKTSGVLQSCELEEEKPKPKIKVKEVVWTDEEGKPQTLLDPDPADNPLGKDYLTCAIHKPKEAPDPNREAKEKAEKDARQLLAEAEQSAKAYRDGMKKADNLDKDPKKAEEAKKVREEAQKAKGTAIERYEKFLNDYKETFVYKENKTKAEKARDALKK